MKTKCIISIIVVTIMLLTSALSHIAVNSYAYSGEICKPTKAITVSTSNTYINSYLNTALAAEGKNASDLDFSSAWCGYFVNWVARQTSLTQYFPTYSQCANGSLILKNMPNYGGKSYVFWSDMEEIGMNGVTFSNRNSFTPLPGDIVIFRTSYNSSGQPYVYRYSHVGIVYKVTDSDIYVVHGNWGSKVTVGTKFSRSGSNKYGDYYYLIAGYARPNYPASNFIFDLNAFIDGEYKTDLGNRGTVDIYLDGVLVADDCIDFYQEVPQGTYFEIKNIKATDGNVYSGASRGLSGYVTEQINIQLYFDAQYTVTFKDWDGTTLKTQTVSHGGAATAPTSPTRTGYTFAGWNKAFNNITTNTTVTAMYSLNTYTVTFKDWDGTTLKTQTVNYGGAATAPSTPTRTGYTFTGWNKAFNNITTNTTVTAMYSLNTYTVTFKDWDGTTLKTQTVNYGGAATAPTSPTRTGYTFAGWDKAFNNITTNTTVTAMYSLNTYTVTFKDWDGTTLKTQTINYGGAATAPTSPTRTGYTFAGWDKTFYNITTNTTVTAMYSLNSYTVTFKDWDGITLKTQTVNYGGAATAPSTPTRTGYTFTGWDKAFNNITTNTTVTAMYSLNTYTVTFKDWDGTTLKTQTVNYGSAASAPSNPSRIGYTFTGWDKSFSSITSNTTVTAVYSKNNENEPIVMLGDINGDGMVNSLDAARVLKFDALLIELSETALIAADVNGDGSVNSLDAAIILKYDAGLIESF